MKSFSKDRRIKMSDEEKVLDVIDRSAYALSQEDIHSGVSEVLFTTRQRLKNILEDLVRQGKIERKIYNILFSRNPRIYSVISEIYFTRENQRLNYERDILPRLEREARHILR